MLTIANFERIKKGAQLPVIVILARTHAGQTVSSWIMHNLIKFLVSKSEEAQALRNTFIFKLFPMVNPDGVVHGNYRCSLIGRDLNRRWKNPSKQLYPEVYFIKNQIADTHQKKQIRMVLDLHGHTQKKKSFFYGCSDRVAPHRPRLFPYLTTKISGLFEFGSCNFAIQKSKEATARITLYNLIRIPEIFTLETSMFGMGDHFLSSQVFQGIAQTIVKAFYKFYKVEKVKTEKKEKEEEEEEEEITEQKAEVEAWEEELMGNPGLLKVGCEPSDGSDSQPSVCNLQFDKINKMILQNQQKRSPEVSIKKKLLVRPQSSIKPSLTRKNQGYSIGLSRQISEKMNDNGFQKLKERGLSPPPSRRIPSSQRHQNTKTLNPKLQFTGNVHSITRIKEYTNEYRPLRMINFQLLIDESSQRRSSTRETFDTGDLRIRHTNYHMFYKGRGMSRPPQLNKQSM